MKKTDRKLGMDRVITRRDFIHDSALGSLGLTLAAGFTVGDAGAAPVQTGRYYPPTLTGLRGSHPGSFEPAHDYLRDGKALPRAEDSGEQYDLVIVGGGISGLASAMYYRERFGPESRILILENHDDFGGHAKRNEYHHDGQMRLTMGGTHNLEYPQFSPGVWRMMEQLGVDIEVLKKRTGFAYGFTGPGQKATWFDAETYGRDVLIPGFSLRNPDPEALHTQIDQMPISAESRERLKHFFALKTSEYSGLAEDEVESRLRRISYFDFLRSAGGLNEELIDLFRTITHGSEGFGAVNLSAMEALEIGLPGINLLGKPIPDPEFDYKMVMFPDGNASIARLMVQNLIPSVSPGANADNIAVAEFDYSRLDLADQPIRLRLNSTVVRTTNHQDSVDVHYLNEGKPVKVRARHCILACYHVVIPHLCPELPEPQKQAQMYQVKCPLLLTSVLLRDDRALRERAISSAHCPGRMHPFVYRFHGNTAGGFHQGAWEHSEGPATVIFWGSVAEPPGDITLKDRLRASRAKMLALKFEDYEREVRNVLNGMLGPAGFDAKEDILAITVNRWPHGYAYFYTDLWDPDFEDGQYPHQIARQPFGNIAIANADAAADAYTHAAIDEAHRAVSELPG